MSDYETMVRLLEKEQYCFFTCFDKSLSVNEIHVETENPHMILIYRFDKYGCFDEMWYTSGVFHKLLTMMLHCNLMSNQFSKITMHYGIKKAKAEDRL